MKPNSISDELAERLEGFLAEIGERNDLPVLMVEALELLDWMKDELEEGGGVQ